VNPAARVFSLESNLLSKRLLSGIILFRSAVYGSSVISFGEKMARIISANHFSKNCTHELSLGSLTINQSLSLLLVGTINSINIAF